MKRILTVFTVSLIWLAVADFSVRGGLALIGDRVPALTRMFDYGRSVPGKLEQWNKNPAASGNLFEIAWRPDLVSASAESFSTEDSRDGPVARGYGMSFLNQLMRAAAESDPDLRIDLASGPAAPPNFAYALYQDDAANRRSGDIVVLGILSSSAPAAAAMSNRTWLFEQPSPFTYPVYRLEGEGLHRMDPLVESLSDQLASMSDPAFAARWSEQLSEKDFFHSAFAFGLPVLDASPFARLTRRALVAGDIERREKALRDPDGPFPLRETLRRIALGFVAEARAAGEFPVVVLIQGRDRMDVDLLDAMGPALDAAGAAYLATASFIDPRDPTRFIGDGHFTHEANRVLADEFLRLISPYWRAASPRIERSR